MLTNLLLDIIYVFLANLLIIILGTISAVRARNGKSHWALFSVAIILKLISGYGIVSGIMRNPDLWISRENMMTLVSNVVFTLIFSVLIKKLEKK